MQYTVPINPSACVVFAASNESAVVKSPVLADPEKHANCEHNVVVSLQPKLMAKDLLDLVASHFNLKEKEYFGIAYTDET